MSILRILVFLPLLFQQGITLDETQARYYEAMELASAEGIPSLVRKLDSLVESAPASSFAPRIRETICVIGLLHPGSVPNMGSRLAPLKSSAAGNPEMSKVVKRIEILQSYYAAAMDGHPESASAALSDPVFEGSPYALQAQADAALRAGDFEKAAMSALQVIEADPYSPLLANAHMILGLSSEYRGDSKSALTHFRRALASSELPTIYGNPRDYVFTTYRFSRPVPAAIGDVFDDAVFTRLQSELKEPLAMVFVNNSFLVLDKETLVTFSIDGKLLDKKPVRNTEDIAAGNGRVFSITKDRIDFGGGSSAALSLTAGKRTKRIDALRSFAVGTGGEFYFLDEDAGLLHGKIALPPAASINVSPLAPVKGRLVRADSWGNIYLLDDDRKTILVLSREGKSLTSIAVEPVAGKVAPIEYFALDSLNHLYILASNSIQVFAMRNGDGGFDKKRISVYAFDQRPQFKNLRVMGVSTSGELVVTGKNENNWVCFK